MVQASFGISYRAKWCMYPSGMIVIVEIRAALKTTHRAPVTLALSKLTEW